jgi:hypothetical protein
MIQALKKDNNVNGDSINIEKRLRVKLNEIPCFINKTIESFISDKTLNFLKGSI